MYRIMCSYGHVREFYHNNLCAITHVASFSRMSWKKHHKTRAFLSGVLAALLKDPSSVSITHVGEGGSNLPVTPAPGGPKVSGLQVCTLQCT